MATEDKRGVNPGFGFAEDVGLREMLGDKEMPGWDEEKGRGEY